MGSETRAADETSQSLQFMLKGWGRGKREMCGEGDTISLDDFSIKGQKKNVISLPYLSEAYTCPSFHANFFRLSSNYTSN